MQATSLNGTQNLENILLTLQHATKYTKYTANMDRFLFKRVLQTPGSLLRSSIAARSTIRASPTTRTISAVPRIASSSFWKSMIPKPLRRENRSVPDSTAPKKSWLSGEWNPATFFGIIFLLIGSMSIQMIWLRKTFDTHTRRSDVRIGLLREVVEKLQKGEQVDVEQALGSGDPDKEAMWDEGKSDGEPHEPGMAVLTFVTVLADIEKESASRNQKNQDKSKTPESSPTSLTAKPASTTEPPADAASAQAQSKGQTAYFF